MPSRFGISKKLRPFLFYSGFTLLAAALLTLICGYIQLERFSEPFTIEWANEASSLWLHFDKKNPLSGRVVFVGHTPLGQRMVSEYQELSKLSSPGIYIEDHRLYSAISGDQRSMDTFGYLDYFAYIKLELNHLYRSALANQHTNTPLLTDTASSEIYLQSLFTRGLYKQADNTLVDQLRLLVQKAVPGSYVRFSVFLFYYENDNEPLLLDLLAAAARGVNIQLITDLPESDNSQRRGAGQVFQEAFEKRLSEVAKGKSDSWIKRHGNVSWDSKNHTKIFLFSDSAGFKNWVIVTSENLTDTERQKYQAGLLMRDKLSYDAFDQYWNQILKGNYSDLWSASSGTNLTHHFFPQTTGDDEIYRQLDRITIIPGTTQKSKLSISMARWNFERFPLAMKLVELAEKGVQIEIVTRNNPQIVDDVILKLLSHRPNIALHTANVDKLNIHSKYVLFDGYYRDGDMAGDNQPKKILWVGSHNFTGMAMRNNYETWSEVRNERIFQDFSDNFLELKSLVPTDAESSDLNSDVAHNKSLDNNAD